MTYYNDYLHGARDIGEHLNVSPRRAFYLLENNLIPAGKIGNTWVSRRSRIDSAIEALVADVSTARGSDGKAV